MFPLPLEPCHVWAARDDDLSCNRSIARARDIERERAEPARRAPRARERADR